MGKSTTAAQMAGKIRNAGKAIEKNRTEQLRALGNDMTDIFNKAVSSDLTVTGTPHGFKNWVQDLQATGKVQGNDLVFAPVGKSKGPIRAAESGTTAYKAGDRRLTGKVSKKTGNALSRKVKHGTGKTEGKGTWSDAVTEIADKLPPKIQSGFTKAAMEVFR